MDRVLQMLDKAEDKFWHFKQSFEDLLNISQKMSRPSDKLAIKPVYPLE